MAASQQVGGLPELLEMILLKMPRPDILLAQRVSRTWKRTIEASPHLQKALFFRPINDSPYMMPDLLGPTGPMHSTACREKSHCEMEERTKFQCQAPLPISDPEIIRYRPTSNPFSKPLLGWLSSHNFKLGDVRRTSAHSSCWLEEASWRKMLVSQPALLGTYTESSKNDHRHRVEAKDVEKGLTLDDLQSSADVSFGSLRTYQFKMKPVDLTWFDEERKLRKKLCAENVLKSIEDKTKG